MMNYESMKTSELKAPLLAAMRSGDRATVEAIGDILKARGKAAGINTVDVKPSARAIEEYKREVLNKRSNRGLHDL